MKNRNTLLIALFVLQILLSGGLYFGKAASSSGPAHQALVNADKKEIDRITIENGEGEKVVLQKTGKHWTLPNYHHLPANPAKVDTLLDRLLKLQGGWPVATTAAAQKRFEVAEEKFQRRITLSNGEDVRSELYVGTSPGFRKVHARKADDKAVFSVIFNVFDTPAQNRSWLDRSLLQPKGEVAAIQGPDFHLTRIKGEWAAVKPDGEVDTEAAEQLLKAMTGLQVDGVAKEDIPEDQQEDTGSFLVTAGGEEKSYHFFSANGSYFVRQPGYDVTFTLSKPAYDNITNQTASTLVLPKENKSEEALTEQAEPEAF